MRPPFPHTAQLTHEQRGTDETDHHSGNNAIAFKGAQTNLTSQSASGQFIFTQDPNQSPTVAVNVDAARTNAFYIVNTVHDISFVYGFTETTFNFQQNNFGHGAQGNDRVTISVQDTAGRDNGGSMRGHNDMIGHITLTDRLQLTSLLRLSEF